MLLLVNLKNEIAKKDLRLAYAQGNLSAYPDSCEKIARFLLSQYANKRTAILVAKRGTRTRRMITPSQKTRVITMKVL